MGRTAKIFCIVVNWGTYIYIRIASDVIRRGFIEALPSCVHIKIMTRMFVHFLINVYHTKQILFLPHCQNCRFYQYKSSYTIVKKTGATIFQSTCEKVVNNLSYHKNIILKGLRLVLLKN